MPVAQVDTASDAAVSVAEKAGQKNETESKSNVVVPNLQGCWLLSDCTTCGKWLRYVVLLYFISTKSPVHEIIILA